MTHPADIKVNEMLDVLKDIDKDNEDWRQLAKEYMETTPTNDLANFLSYVRQFHYMAQEAIEKRAKNENWFGDQHQPQQSLHCHSTSTTLTPDSSSL